MNNCGCCALMNTKALWGSNERMGKKSGVLISGAPKYRFARALSYVLYFALAGSVHGGLLPEVPCQRGVFWATGKWVLVRTAADIDPAQKHGNYTALGQS